MLKARALYTLLVSSLLVSTATFSAGTNGSAAPGTRYTPPDSNLYTSYFFNTGFTNVDLVVCGSTQETGGCYGSADLGPFGKAGALIEGNPAVDRTTNTVTRYIYVVDEAVAGGKAVNLYVYRKTDAITPTFDTVTVTLEDTVPLPLTGGAVAKTYMAADNDYLFIGTNRSPFAVRVQKTGFAIEQVGGFSPPSNVSSITSDAYGFITVTFGNSDSSSGNYEFDPNGNGVGDGGGAWYMLGTSVGLSTGNPVITMAAPPRGLHVSYKQRATQDVRGH